MSCNKRLFRTLLGSMIKTESIVACRWQKSGNCLYVVDIQANYLNFAFYAFFMINSFMALKLTKNHHFWWYLTVLVKFDHFGETWFSPSEMNILRIRTFQATWTVVHELYSSKLKIFMYNKSYSTFCNKRLIRTPPGSMIKIESNRSVLMAKICQLSVCGAVSYTHLTLPTKA